MLQPRDLVLKRLVLGLKPATAWLSFSFCARNRSTSPTNRRTKPISSVGIMRSSEPLAVADMSG